MGKDLLISLSKQSNLPQELPENLVYWIRCETLIRDTQVENQLISNSDLKLFYEQRVSLFDALNKELSISESDAYLTLD